MNTASSTRYGLAAAGLVVCLGLAACGGGSGGSASQPAAPVDTPTTGNPPQAPGGEQPATPALKCAP